MIQFQKNGELGPLFKEINPEILNKIQMKDSWIDRVQEGFRQVYQTPGGTAYRTFGGKSYKPAGKTGTAENAVFHEITGERLADTNNYVLVGYAPHDDPEIAFAVVVPNLGVMSGQYPASQKIGEELLDTYFQLKKSVYKQIRMMNKKIKLIPLMEWFILSMRGINYLVIASAIS